jgi:hypothetical protein
LRLDLPELLRAPDFDDLRDEVDELFAAERVFEALLFRAPLARFDPLFDPLAFEPLAFEPRALERALLLELLEPELFVEPFDERFAPLFDPPRAAERELFVPPFDALLRAVDFFAPLLLELLPELLLDFLAAPFDPDPSRLPPPSCLLTVAQARRSASSSDTPRLS